MTETVPPQPFNEFHQHGDACWWNHLEARRECPPTTTTTPAGAHPPVSNQLIAGTPVEDMADDRPLVDVRDMIVVHTAMLREFRLAGQAVARVTPGDRRAARRVDAHLSLLCDLLHHHHSGEDELLWPPLRAVLPPAGQALLDEAEAQHDGLDQALDQVGAARRRWAHSTAATDRDTLITAVGVLHELLAEHLDAEEKTLLPLAASHLTPGQWAAVGEAGAGAVPKAKLLLVFGMFAYEGDPGVVAGMLHSAPPPARFIVPLIAPRIYARYARRIHGTTRP